MKLLSVVLLLLPLSICLAEVVKDFTKSCPGFFATPNDVVSPPTGFTGTQYKQICQTRNNQAEFATLYDTENRIPVYSAYRFTGQMKCNRLDKWHTEPELEAGMQDQNQKTCLVNQAENGDYKKSGYDRGHLAPVFLATSQNCADATFTLTNAAPQAAMFNRNTWMRTEKNMNDTLTKDCLNVGWRAFVVTGVVPGTDTLKNEGRVRIPSHFWMAFCCLDNNNKPKHSGAYIGQNNDNDCPVYRWSVQDLEPELTELYRKQFHNIPDFHFTFFAGECYTETETNELQIIENKKRKMSQNERNKDCQSNKRQKL
ncbi:endonuclease domain-containing 1 protein-like [Ictalurus furcatus]|uniref:endonuclease domain-containing 1 protein-like n=1 Tax=Ictalurus furcatus TaxID=66913 RepID=UPI00234FC2D6|nr:endonuclease domain-containing 1 protein-like [Ictalurus furcatus]XP_053472201.1 endonuclease domain-containing 1 protein-like [Ictalurus furcatus]